MDQQEYFMRINMLGQEAEKTEQQIQAIDQQINELNSVKDSLNGIESNNGGEILAHLGKGIFVKAELKEKDLYVNVGKEIVMKKSIAETLKIIENQGKLLLEGKEELIAKIQNIQEKMQEFMEAGQASIGEKGSTCSSDCSCGHEHEEDKECDGNCDCEEPCEDCKSKDEKKK